MSTIASLPTLSDGNHFNSDYIFFMMTDALGRKDRYTQAHAQRVSQYAKRLAQELDLPAEEIHRIELGGMLHDVGKLGLNDQVFDNRSPDLTPEMWWQVHNHPLIGAALLRRFHGMGTIHDAVLLHHERLDGSGYPFGLQGDAIPLSARIVGIADCFDAITTDRPYQKRKNCQKALTILKQMAGQTLDAELVDRFIEIIRRTGIIAGPLIHSQKEFVHTLE